MATGLPDLAYTAFAVSGDTNTNHLEGLDEATFNSLLTVKFDPKLPLFGLGNDLLLLRLRSQPRRNDGYLQVINTSLTSIESA
jgi:hypothetical protein